MCEKNMGSADRLLRIILGLVLLVLMVLSVIGAWGWLGVIPLATGALGFCPAYKPFGISTCRLEKE